MIKTIINLISLFFCYWNAFTFSVACARVYRDIPFVSWNKRKNFYEKRRNGVQIFKSFGYPVTYTLCVTSEVIG